MGLKDVINRGWTPPAEEVMLTEVYTPEPSPPAAPVAEQLVLRDLREGEVGNVDSPKYPDVPYSEEALRLLLTRLRKGCDYLLDNLTTAQGHNQIGYFNDLAESTQVMLIAHMAHHILNES